MKARKPNRIMPVLALAVAALYALAAFMWFARGAIGRGWVYAAVAAVWVGVFVLWLRINHWRRKDQRNLHEIQKSVAALDREGGAR